MELPKKTNDLSTGKSEAQITLGKIIYDHYGDITAHHYDKISSQLFWAYPESLRSMAADIIWAREWVKDRKEIKILDLGAGTGNTSVAFINELLLFLNLPQPNIKIDLQLLDLSIPMLKKGEEKIKKYFNIDLELLIENLENWNTDLKYDLVISSYAIHHLDEKEKKIIIKKIYNSLNKGGMLSLLDKMWLNSNDPHISENAFSKVVGSRFIQIARESKPDISIEEMSEIIRNDFIRDGDQPSSLNEHINWFKEAGFSEVTNPFTSFGIALVSGIKI